MGCAVENVGDAEIPFLHRIKNPGKHIFSSTVTGNAITGPGKTRIPLEFSWDEPRRALAAAPGLEAPLPRGPLLSLCLTRRENLSALGKSVFGGKLLKHFK